MPNYDTDTAARVQEIMAVDVSVLPPDGGNRFNRLIFATSPYLLQHAENPVDWYQWGDEAFDKAKREDKPILLSIGYATCHWCHVMAHESFEDPEVAAVLNMNFVSIKVDREERPDIDGQYMTVAQMMTGGGGWPLNIFMTPDKRPFYAVTYLPRHPRGGMPGIISLLERIASLWREDRPALERSAKAVLDALAPRLAEFTLLPGEEILQEAAHQLEQIYDRVHGGFGAAPKFPMPVYLSYLLRYGHWQKEPQMGGMALRTLQAIRFGGVYDQIGGGIHRYSVDNRWLIPHFEKMLYDQALMASAFFEAFQVSGNAFYLSVGEEICDFVAREMTAPQGGFHSGQDADTEGEEGTYYLWTPDEIAGVVGEADAPLICRFLGITDAGNFEGKSVPHLNEPAEAFAVREGLPVETVQEKLTRLLQSLLQARLKRPRPFRDEKIITSWNGLMIAAFARGFALTGREEYRSLAEKTADFILQQLVAGDGRLLRSYNRGRSSGPAFLEDYAFLVHGLLELYQTTLDGKLLDRAWWLNQEMLRLFRDDESAGLLETGSDMETVLVRTRDDYDGVTPSGTSVAAANLLKLAKIKDDAELEALGRGVIRASMVSAKAQPLAHLALLSAQQTMLAQADVATFSIPESGLDRGLLRLLWLHYQPSLVVRHGEPAKYPLINDRTTLYLCKNQTCHPPVADERGLRSLLSSLV